MYEPRDKSKPWKTYVGRPETDKLRGFAISFLAIGLLYAKRHEDALAVGEAELSLKQRLGDSEEHLLAAQGNLAVTYEEMGRHEEALDLQRDVSSGRLRLNGEEHEKTLLAATNYTVSLLKVKRLEEARSLMRKTIPVARHVLGEGHRLTLMMSMNYARALIRALDATLDDLREAVTTLENAERTARRVLGGAHPLTKEIEEHLRQSRAALRARETP